MLIVLIVACNGLFAQKEKLNTQSFQDELKNLMHEKKVPAVGIGIIDDGVLQQIKVYGELRENTPAPYNSIFNVASLSKPIAMILTLRLVSNGDWDLDEPLHRYWVDPDVKDDPLHKKLTSRHVLNHTTGFDNWRRMHASKKLTFNSAPGEKIKYSGEGFEYLRRAIESKFSIPYENLVDSLVFKLYGMKDTRILWDENFHKARYAEEHNKNRKPYNLVKREKNACASDDVLTSIEDYGLFAVNVMMGTGLSNETHKDMLRLQAIKDDKGGFGLGWYIVKDFYRGEYVIMHDGSDRGVATKVMLFPESKSGIVILTNGDHGFDIIKMVENAYFSSEQKYK